ncbi:helix-turn-helix transcriptional regulator [Streptomyces sp. NBC_01264]|uniref:helix-turn-helix transcriptional regulator n=1 Tax=Streptomyces sp. NBC_01264 TaxID=2903804 RepID=UPI00225A26A4|nr:ArsR family transcriptional regulator [Streptomyces sp. NBC_01264]MCX4775691.1 ArsR family transcriptional regulator [Streptomyces sp. NBC_01264]
MTEMPRGVDAQRVHHALAVPSRQRLMTLLREADGLLGVDDLAAATGLSVATVRHHLATLAEAGLVAATASAGPGRGRPRLRYAATRPDPQEEPADAPFRELAQALADAVGGGPGACREAGLGWGRRLTGSGPATERVFAAAARMGFAPQDAPGPDPDTRRVLLHACPYRELARTRPEVVCAVHQGVLDGLLEADGATVRLLPFIGPDLCAADLRST